MPEMGVSTDNIEKYLGGLIDSLIAKVDKLPKEADKAATKTVQTLEKTTALLSAYANQTKDIKLNVNTEEAKQQVAQAKQMLEEFAKTAQKTAATKLTLINNKDKSLTERITAIQDLIQWTKAYESNAKALSNLGSNFPTFKVGDKEIQSLEALNKLTADLTTQQKQLNAQKAKEVKTTSSKTKVKEQEAQITAASKQAITATQEALTKDALSLKVKIDTNLAAISKGAVANVNEEANKAASDIARLKARLDYLNETGIKLKVKETDMPILNGKATKVKLSQNDVDPEAARGLVTQLQNAVNKAGESLDAKAIWKNVSSPEAMANFKQQMLTEINTVGAEMAKTFKDAGLATPEQQNQIQALQAELPKLVEQYQKLEEGEQRAQIAGNLSNKIAEIEKLGGVVNSTTLGLSKMSGMGKVDLLNQIDETRLTSIGDKLYNITEQIDKARAAGSSQNGQLMSSLTEQIEQYTQAKNILEQYAKRNSSISSANKLSQDSGVSFTIKELEQEISLSETALKELEKIKAAKQQVNAVPTPIVSATPTVTTGSNAGTAGGTTGAIIPTVDPTTLSAEVSGFRAITAEVNTLIAKLNEKTQAIQTEAGVMQTASKTETAAIGRIVSGIEKLKQSISSIDFTKLQGATNALANANQASTNNAQATPAASGATTGQGTLNPATLANVIPSLNDSATKYAQAVTAISDSINNLNKSLGTTDIAKLQALTAALTAQAATNNSNKQANKSGSQGFNANKTAMQSANKFITSGTSKLYTNQAGLSAQEIQVISQEYQKLQTLVTAIGKSNPVTPQQLQNIEDEKAKITALTAAMGQLKKVQADIGGMIQTANGLVGKNGVDSTKLTALIADLNTIQSFVPVQNGVMDNAAIQATVKLIGEARTSLDGLAKAAQSAADKSAKAAQSAVQRYVTKIENEQKRLAEAQARGLLSAQGMRTTIDKRTGNTTVESGKYDTGVRDLINGLYTQLSTNLQNGTVTTEGLPRQLMLIKELANAYSGLIPLLGQLKTAQENALGTPAATTMAQTIDTLTKLFGYGDKTISDTQTTKVTTTGLLSAQGVLANIDLSNFERARATLDAFQASVDSARTALKNLGSAPYRDEATARLSRNYEDLMNKMTQFAQANSKFMADPTLAANYTKLFQEVQNGSNRSVANLARLTGQFKSLQSTIITTGNTGRSAFAEVQRIFNRIGGNFLIASAVFKIRSSIKDLFTTVKELDTELTKLKRVTNETDETYEKFMHTAGLTAQAIGSTMVDVVSATAEFAKLGYSLQDAETLSQNVLVYAKVADLDIDTAVEDMVSAMKAFNIEAKDSMRIVDELNELGNKFSVNAAQLGTILKKSSSTLAISGDSMEQIIAMGTAMNEIIQDEDTTGTTLKMLGLRLRGAKTEIEDAGESLDGMATSTSKLREKILALTNVSGKGGFDIMSDPDSFKTTYDIIKGISSVWKDMSQIDQAAILELIAGKNRAQGAAALIKNFSQAEKALDTALNSQGSAKTELERYIESIEGRINSLRGALNTLANDSLKSGVLKTAVSTVSALVKLLDKGTSTLGTIPTILTGIAVTASMMGKNLGVLTPWTMGKKIWNTNQAAGIGVTDPYLANNALATFESTTFANAQAGIIETPVQQIARIDAAIYNLNGTLQEYGKHCKTLNQPMSANGYMAFLRDGGYTKGFKGVSQTIKAYNAIPASVKDLNPNATTAQLAAATADNQAIFTSQIQQSNAKLGEYMGKLNGAQGSMGGYAKSLAIATAKSLGLRMATMLLNGVLAMLVSTLLTKGIQAIDSLIHRNEKIVASGQEATKTVNELAKAYQNLAKQTSNIAPEYAKLAQGVDALGRNKSLSTDDYAKFLEYSNELADLYPQLIRGTDSNNNKLLSLSGTIEEITNQLYALKDAERAVAAEDIYSNMQQQLKALEQTVSKQNAGGYNDLVSSEAKMLLDPKNMPNATGGLFFNGDNHKENLKETQKQIQEMERQWAEATAKEVEVDYSPISVTISTYLDWKLTEKGFESDVVQAAQKYFNTVLSTDIADKNMLYKAQNMETYVNALIDTIAQAEPDVQEAFVKLLSDAADIPSGEMSTLADTLAEQLGLDDDGRFVLRVALQLDTENGVDYESRIKQMMGAYDLSALNYGDSLKYSRSEFESTLREMKADEFTQFEKLISGTSTPGIANVTDQLKSVLQEIKQEEAKAISDAVSVSDTITGQNELKESIDSLMQSYEQLTSGDYDSSDLYSLFADFPELATYSNDVEGLKKAIKELVGVKTDEIANELQSVMETLPDGEKKQQLQGFVLVLRDMTRMSGDIGELAKQFTSLSEALQRFASVSDAVEQAQSDLKEFGQFSMSTLTTILDTFGDNSAIQNAVAEYLAGMRDANSLMSELKNGYDADAKNSAKYLQEKLQYSEAYYKHCKFLNNDFVNGIKDNYGVDLSNCRTYAQAKIAILEQIGNVAQNVATAFTLGAASNVDLSQYIDTTTGETTAAYEALKSGTIGKTEAQIITLVQDVQKKYSDYLGEFDTGLVDIVDTFTNADALSDNDSSASDATDAWKEAADAELATLEHLRAMQLITSEQYYNELNRINNKYFKNYQDKYLSDYRSMLEKARSAYIDMYNDELADYKYQYDMKYITASDYYNKMKELNDRYFKGNTSFEDEYRSNNVEVFNGLKQAYTDAYSKEKQNLDHLRNMDVIDDKAYYFELEKLVEKYYKGRIEFVDEYKSAEEEIYQGLHDMKLQALQEEMDALQKTADKNKEVLDTEKKRTEYFNALRQKTERVYDESKGGWIWEAKQQDVADTKQAYEEALQEKEIQAIQDLIDALEKNTYNLNYVDPETGQLVQAEHFDLLTQTQYDQLYASTFGEGGIKNLVDGLSDMTSTIKKATDIVMMGAQDKPISYFNVEKVIANDAQEFVASMSEFLNDANNRSALIGK